MSNTVIHRAATRGSANHGWLEANHSFSFANYYNPQRMNFGVLRVLNDDKVAGGMGFGMHPHDNMEIITIPLEGALAHKDSMGNQAVIQSGDVQVMSAGTGVFHSEFNHSTDEAVKLLQIWLYPNKMNVEPRYEQITFPISERHNKWQQILSPNPEDEGVWIYQDAWFSLGKFDAHQETHYSIKKEGNGAYVFIISGQVEINGEVLNTRDAIGVWNSSQIKLSILEEAEILIMDIPMKM